MPQISPSIGVHEKKPLLDPKKNKLSESISKLIIQWRLDWLTTRFWWHSQTRFIWIPQNEQFVLGVCVRAGVFVFRTLWWVALVCPNLVWTISWNPNIVSSRSVRRAEYFRYILWQLFVQSNWRGLFWRRTTLDTKTHLDLLYTIPAFLKIWNGKLIKRKYWN